MYNDMLWDEPRFEADEGGYLDTKIAFAGETMIGLPSKYVYLGQYSDLTAYISSDHIGRIKRAERFFRQNLSPQQPAGPS